MDYGLKVEFLYVKDMFDEDGNFYFRTLEYLSTNLNWNANWL